MLRRFTLALCMSLAVAVSGQIAAAEDNAEPPVIRDEALADKQPVDPVKVEKMAAEVRQVHLTEDMVNRFIARLNQPVLRDTRPDVPMGGHR